MHCCCVEVRHEVTIKVQVKRLNVPTAGMPIREFIVKVRRQWRARRAVMIPFEWELSILVSVTKDTSQDTITHTTNTNQLMAARSSTDRAELCSERSLMQRSGELWHCASMSRSARITAMCGSRVTPSATGECAGQWTAVVTAAVSTTSQVTMKEFTLAGHTTSGMHLGLHSPNDIALRHTHGQETNRTEVNDRTYHAKYQRCDRAFSFGATLARSHQTHIHIHPSKLGWSKS